MTEKFIQSQASCAAGHMVPKKDDILFRAVNSSMEWHQLSSVSECIDSLLWDTILVVSPNTRELNCLGIGRDVLEKGITTIRSIVSIRRQFKGMFCADFHSILTIGWPQQAAWAGLLQRQGWMPEAMMMTATMTKRKWS